MKKTNKIKLLLLIIILLSIIPNLHSAPFLGGYFQTNNSFEQDNLVSKHAFSFYLNHKINDYAKFYTRLTAGFKYTGSYLEIAESINIQDYNSIKCWTLIPNIDLLFFEIKSIQKGMLEKLDENGSYGYVNYHFFLTRIGRVHVNQSSGFFFNMKGDGLDTYFTLKNFRFHVFAITNSFDYLPVFDFNDSSAQPVFTNWDRKRMPPLSNAMIEDNYNNFIYDINSSDYNFFFQHRDSDDYTKADAVRMNNMRYAACLAGRLFTGFSFELNQVFFQNFSWNFLANIDLVPQDYVIAYPSQMNQVNNTFGGKYTSFYLSFSASGKIVRGLFYNFEGVYETGYNATYYDTSDKIIIKNELINTFALYARLSYYFTHVTKPSIHVYFMYAHGDEDVEFINGTIVNKNGQDNNYRSPTSYQMGYVVDPYFSNLIIVGLANTVKPFAALKNPSFSRFSIETALLIILRPIIKGSTFLSERPEYWDTGEKYENPEKAYLGFEADLNLSWQVFSDFAFDINGGVFIPNYLIYKNQDVFWKVGFSFNISF